MSNKGKSSQVGKIAGLFYSGSYVRTKFYHMRNISVQTEKHWFQEKRENKLRTLYLTDFFPFVFMIFELYTHGWKRKY